eukprot:290567-Pyramimonas_sp.AAC.1
MAQRAEILATLALATRRSGSEDEDTLEELAMVKYNIASMQPAATRAAQTIKGPRQSGRVSNRSEDDAKSYDIGEANMNYTKSEHNEQALPGSAIEQPRSPVPPVPPHSLFQFDSLNLHGTSE